jgi:histidyl-tRNA synthetase
MASKYKVSRGTFDVLPSGWDSRRYVEWVATSVCGRAGYRQISTPVFEDTKLFVRGVGKSTDIVQKEMFTFLDKGDRSLTLRPEGTAPICRAYLEHGMHKLAQPVKLFYVGPFFRHERPQAGRHRQFHQIGIECIGSESPLCDAEVIVLMAELIAALEIPGVELRLGSLGSLEARRSYLEDLKGYLRRNEGELPAGVRERIEINPLRAFDSSHEGTQAVMAGAPRLIDHLSGEDAEHFEAVQRLLEANGLPYTIDPTLVRGLDYYSRTIFSFVCDRLGAQSEIGGGGRYDGLIEQLGGPETPAIGWAIGIERIMLALELEMGEPELEVFVAAVAPRQRMEATLVVSQLRRAEFSADLDLGERSLKGQLKHADRLGARWVLLLEEDGSAQLRDMYTRRQEPIDSRRAVEVLTEAKG